MWLQDTVGDIGDESFFFGWSDGVTWVLFCVISIEIGIGVLVGWGWRGKYDDIVGEGG